MSAQNAITLVAAYAGYKRSIGLFVIWNAAKMTMTAQRAHHAI